MSIFQDRVLAILMVGALMALTNRVHSTPAKIDDSLPFNLSLTPALLKKECAKFQKQLQNELDTLAKVTDEQANFKNSFWKLDLILTGFVNNTNFLTFMKDVSTDAKLREASTTCSEEIGRLLVDVYAREDLYRVLKSALAKKETLNEEDTRLVDELFSRFKRNGLELTPKIRKEFIKMRKQIVTLQEAYAKRVRDMSNDFELVSEKELGGMAPDYIAGLKKTKDGKFKIGMDKASSIPFMENASNEAARKRVHFKYSMIGGEKNVEAFEKTIRLRQETAKMLGFPTHAHYVLERRMAKSPENVLNFLNPLIARLKEKGERELAELSALKKADNPNNPNVESWDWRYYQNQLTKKKFQIDNQKIKEYFPLSSALSGMFEIFETILEVKFIEEKAPETWHPSIRLFKVMRNQTPVAYFYLDLFPREGKYNHFAAFDLLLGHETESGVYRAPVAAIVGNFTPAVGDAPPLLEHGEVETMFHEFGHIMHQTLTLARHGSLSGANVLWDFVEAPSQMLENWVWKKEVLKKLSSHHKNPSEKLPEDVINRMIEAKNLHSGIGYLRQAAFAMVDLTYHTSENVDGKSTKIYSDTMKKIMLVPSHKGTFPQASFGHLMGGYDAGYYGYLYSRVYAEDMFTRFAKEGLLNAKAGADYRTNILEPGGTREPMDLIRRFLAREPNQDAFLKSIGL